MEHGLGALLKKKYYADFLCCWGAIFIFLFFYFIFFTFNKNFYPDYIVYLQKLRYII